MHAEYFLVSAIYRTLTWTTRSLTCVCGHSYACVYTQGSSEWALSKRTLTLTLKMRMKGNDELPQLPVGAQAAMRGDLLVSILHDPGHIVSGLLVVHVHAQRDPHLSGNKNATKKQQVIY